MKPEQHIKLSKEQLVAYARRVKNPNTIYTTSRGLIKVIQDIIHACTS